MLLAWLLDKVLVNWITLSLQEYKYALPLSSLFLLHKIPLLCPQYCSMLARANIHDQLELF